MTSFGVFALFFQIQFVCKATQRRVNSKNEKLENLLYNYFNNLNLKRPQATSSEILSC